MAIRAADLVGSFPDLVTLVRGPAEVAAERPSSATTCMPRSLVFAPNAPALQRALESEACIIVIPEPLGPILPPEAPSGKAILTSPELYLAMAKINSTFFPIRAKARPLGGDGIHPSAVISPSARLGARVTIGPQAVVGDAVEIGDDVLIGAGAVIESKSHIGHRTTIHSLAYVAHDVVIGEDCEIQPNSSIGTEGFGYATDKQGKHFRIPHYGRLIIGDDVHIGAGVQIDRGTFDDAVIKSGTKIDNFCHIGHNNEIGQGCLITAGFIAAGSTKIGDHCVFGGRTTVNGHIEIADQCRFTALSGIHQAVPQRGNYGGYPLMPMRDSARAYASFPHLPKIRRLVHRMARHLGIEETEEANKNGDHGP